ncbi:MAG TPA: LamG-like jellyroll fold domain-containing protein [Chitinophagaceae bacterium]|nr:LamG-like jellyroll fold domain-containing protein [Chitinophagaceae bacterium]
MTAISILRKSQLAFYCLLVTFCTSTSLRAQTNYAISPDGTSTSYADLGTINPTGNFSTGLTVECWVKWGAFNNWSRLLDMGNGTASDNILLANQGTSNNLRFEVYVGGTTNGVSGPANLVTGRWYHVAATLDASGHVALYVDGVSVATGTIPVPNNVSRANCYIGKSNWSGDAYLNGTVDEMRIWNVARTQQQIKSSMFRSIDPATPGLVAYYHMDENGGTTITNSTSGAGAGNGTAAGGLAWTASPIQYGANALDFDGSNDFGVIPNVVSGDFTVEYWMKTSSTGPGNSGSQWYGGNGIVDAEVGGVTNDWGTSLTGQYLAFGIGNPDITIHSTSTVNTGNWVHVAATWNRSTGAMVLYINGVQEATGTSSGTALRTAPPRIMLGELQTSIQPFGGSLDEVRIWNVVRTQAQIQADMNREVDPTSADASNLVAYYTFDQDIATGTNTGVVTVIDQKGTNNATLSNFAMTGSTSNFVSQNNTLVVLPVQLVSFAGRKVAGGIRLDWSTASEQNALDFSVERSADGHTWNSLGTVPAAGNSTILQSYSFLDAAPLPGKNFYRLRLIDVDGKFTYSRVLIILTDQGQGSYSLQSTYITNRLLQVTAREPVVLQLYSVDGKLIWSRALPVGYQAIPLSLPAGGIYILKGGSTTKKLFID